MCVNQTSFVHVLDAQCVAAMKSNPATASVAWRYIPSSMSDPVNIPPVRVTVDAGSFIHDPALPAFTEDALDVYGRPPTHDPSGRSRIITRTGVL